MTVTPENFREGASAFKNVRDWVREQRDKVVTIVNSRVTDLHVDMWTLELSGHRMTSSPMNEHIIPEPETSAR
jgi:hypothetical protein